MKTKVLVILSAVMMLFSFHSQAETQRIVIDMHDQVYQGQQSVLPLRQLIHRQHPRLILDNFNLETVRLVAKSRHGRGQAKLVVGQWDSNYQTISGRPVDWNWDQPRSFDRLDFYPRVRRDDDKRWQIHMNGNIKVRRIVVTLERERGHGGEIKREVCASIGRNYTECRQDSRIIDAQIISQMSNSSCRQGRDWGFHQRILWVNNGCRAIFQLRLAR